MSKELYDWKSNGKYHQFENYKIFYRHTLDLNKKLIVFLHGFPTSSYDYKFLWDNLEEKFSLFTFDFLGLGFSDKPNRKSSIFKQVEILKELLKHYNLDNINIVAHNYGTIVAQELLAQENENRLDFKISKLVLLNGSIFPELYQPTFSQKVLISPLGGLFNRLLGKNKEYFTKKMIALFGKDTLPSQQQIDEFWILNCYNNGNTKVYKFLNYINERKVYGQRWVNAIEQTCVETKMINGIDDPVSGLQIINAYLKRISPKSGIKLANIGHYPQLENPEKVYQEIYSFVS
ncbi:alpha/beta hydrolase [Aquimarina sp. BL5]|uniref:alpha/beta fold hydrolase n=1 Tax=Aquimarina sp. BL5 TaxID=1714860 RepID=UPI000E4CF92B|nr:alpha/beta hydrolase [Aquimarina sp. BL5]AXT50583.1 alpha/beta hydrolase [Aquimarina sp. BL5]RKN02910.1 alpha/beta fold hydrolase [Aquimarina sp. BL5]